MSDDDLMPVTRGELRRWEQTLEAAGPPASVTVSEAIRAVLAQTSPEVPDRCPHCGRSDIDWAMRRDMLEQAIRDIRTALRPIHDVADDAAERVTQHRMWLHDRAVSPVPEGAEAAQLAPESETAKDAGK